MPLIAGMINSDINRNSVIKLTETLSNNTKAIINGLYTENPKFSAWPVSKIREALELNKKNRKNNRYNFLDDTKSKTGVYIFVNDKGVPVYIGKGGTGEKDDLKRRIINECKLNPEEDTGARPSKNIKKHFSLLKINKTNDEVLSILKSWKVISIPIGDQNLDNKYMAAYLESLLILIYKPEFNQD